MGGRKKKLYFICSIICGEISEEKNIESILAFSFKNGAIRKELLIRTETITHIKNRILALP